MESKIQFEKRERKSDANTRGNQEWFIATALLVAYSLLNMLIPTAAAQLFKWFSPSPTTEVLSGFIVVMITLTPILAFSLLGIVYYRMMKEAPFQWSQFKGKDIGIGFLNTLFIIVSNAVLSLIGEQFSFTSSSENQVAINELSVDFPIYIFIATVLIAPVVEEFFYRKLIMGHIFKNNALTGLLISSILFGFAHFSFGSLIENFNPFNLLSYTVMGFFFGLVYYKTKRIEAAIVAHMINNLIATSIVLLVM